MKTIIRASLFSLLLFIGFSHAMEQQKLEETITSLESLDQEQDQQDLKKIAKEHAAQIRNEQKCHSLEALENCIQQAIHKFTGNKKEFTQCLLKELTNKKMLIKIRNLRLSTYQPHLMHPLFDDNISKFDPSKTLEEKINEQDTEIAHETNNLLTMINLPQEIIAHILVVGLHMNDTNSFDFIFNTTLVCKNFYLLKGLLLDQIKQAVHAILLTEALQVAALHSYNNIGKILINSGQVDLDEMSEANLNALLQSFTYNNKKLAKLLLKAGAHLKFKDQQGNTLLMIAVLKGKVKWVKMLLKYDTDYNATNASGNTVLNIAEVLQDKFPKCRKEIFRLIQEKIQQSSENTDQTKLEN